MHSQRLTALVTGTFIAATLQGCANASHNNVLLFGTDTKFGVDVSTEATQGGAPEITVGYKRREAVWMPLVVNDQNCTGAQGQTGDPACTTSTRSGDSALFTGEGGDDSKDAYSVFASFGAKFGANANAGDRNANAEGGLAQFFATGIAAQRLGGNPQVQQVLSVQSATSKDVAAAKAEAALAKAEAEELKKNDEALKSQLGTDKYNEIVADANRIVESRKPRIEFIISCAQPGEGSTKADKVVDDAVAVASSTPVKTLLGTLKGKNASDWRTILESSTEAQSAAFKAATTNCP